MTTTLRVLLLLSGLVVAGCAREQAACRQCGREECRNLAFSVYETSGKVEKTCCPRCALRYLVEKQPQVSRLEVKAFDDASSLDARKAFYVEGSDVHPCTHRAGTNPPTDERGCCLKTVYDRCEPSLVAFGDATKAAEFAHEHGGFVRTWDHLSEAKR
jgi:nitrous oxide reductase accessory protein NosL